MYEITFFGENIYGERVEFRLKTKTYPDIITENDKWYCVFEETGEPLFSILISLVTDYDIQPLF